MNLIAFVLIVCFSASAARAATALDSLKPGEWYEVPNSKLSSVAPSPLPPGYQNALTEAWSGGAFDTKRNQFILWGGGHGNYAGNEVYSFSVDNLKWSRLTNPSTDVGGDEASGLYPDGKPRSRHTYNYIQYVPSIDRFCSFGASAMYPTGAFTSAKLHCLNLDTKAWELKGNTINPSIGAISGYDPSTGLVWMESAGQYSSLSSWNPVTNAWTKHAEYNPTWFHYYSTGAVGNKRFLGIGNGKVFDWDLTQPQNQVKLLTTTGGDSAIGSFCPGFQFHPPSGKFIAWAGGKSVWSLDYATRAWSRIAIASTSKATPTKQAPNGTFGRFQYIPSKDAFIVYNHVNENVYVFKYGTAVTTTPVSPPVIPPVDPPAVIKDTVRIYLRDTVKVYIKQLIKIYPNIEYDTTFMYDTTSVSFSDTSAPATPPVVVAPPAIPPIMPPIVVVPPVVDPPPPGDGTTRFLTTVKVRNTGASVLGSVPVTFGQVLKPGDLKGGETLLAFHNGKKLASQFDLKAAHNDGTGRHGVMSFILDTLAKDEEVSVQLMAGPAPAPVAVLSASLLPAGFDAKLILKIGGVAYSVSLASLSASPSAKTWLSGGEVNEFIVAGPLKDASSNANPHLNAIFSVRQYKKNVRVDLTVENAWTYEPNPKGYIYDVDYTVGGKSALSQSGVRMPNQTRWRFVSWYDTDVKTALTFDKKYLMATGAFPYYDISLTVPESAVASFATSFPIMNPGNINTYMPNTGAQDGIGPLPRWSAAYLVSMDDRLRRNVLANGEAAGAFGIHFRDKVTGYPATIDSYPYFTIMGDLAGSYNPATGKYEMPPRSNDTLQKLVADDAHQPSLAYLPYAITGDWYFLEEMQYWASWNLLKANPQYRNYKEGLFDHTQTRAKAWGMRTLAQAAYITPDAHPMKAHFNGKLNNNLAWFTSQYVGGPMDNKIGYYHDNTYGPYGFAPWQDNFLTFAIGYANQLGFTNAVPFFAFKSKLSVSMLTDPGFCWLQAPAYSMQHSDAAGVPYKDIAAIYKANYPATNGCSGAVMDGYPTSSTGYGANMQPALAVAVDNGSPNAEAAWTKYQSRNPKQYYGDSPQFNVVPRSVLEPLLK